MTELIIAQTENDYRQAAVLFIEYARWLNIDLSFQGFEEELLHLQNMYAHPTGAILLYKINQKYVGCVAIREKEKGIAELKRMYVEPAYQKQGIASFLLEKSLSIATELGYKKIRLDTLAGMLPAINLYKKYGFYEIAPYYFNPEKNAVFFERLL